MYHCRIIAGTYSYASGLEVGRALIAQRELPDAIFCSGDVNGFGVIDAIRRYSDRKLGENISVAGYDAPIIDEFKGYSMTGFRQPNEQLAQDAVEMLMGMMESHDTAVNVIQRPMKLIIRDSTINCKK